jgi:hypothetical protein
MGPVKNSLHHMIQTLSVKLDSAARYGLNGNVEALHKTILDECWRPAFARNLYRVDSRRPEVVREAAAPKRRWPIGKADLQTESGLITKTNLSLPSTAARNAAGKTSASRMPSTSTQTSLPRSSSFSTWRLTNSLSHRE